MKKRLLSLLLVLTMVLGMIPVSVSAETLPFTVTVDGQEMTQITESTLSWVDWSGTAMDATGDTECSGEHTDADQNGACDKCTMTLVAPGQFPMLAVNADGYVIEPCCVTYAAGDTLKDALKASGHVFEGIDSGYISAIDGVVDNFSLYYDGGSFDLNVPASEVTALWFTTNSSQGYSADLLNLADLLVAYSTDDSGVKNYGGARQAYEAAYKDFYQTSNAAKLYKNLKDTMDLFTAFGTAETVPVTLDITQGEGKLTSGLAVFTSEFGTTHSFTDFASVKLAPAEYTFDISDGGYRHVRGSVTVAEGTAITATVPTGTWITSLLLGTKSGYDVADALPMQNVTEGSATYLMPDCAGTSIYPYGVPGADVDPATCKLYYRGYSYNRTWQTTSAVVTNTYTGLQKNSMEGFTGIFEAVLADGDYEQFQTFTVTVVRVPTLKELSASFDGTALKLDFDPNVSGYAATVTSDSVDISAGTLCEGVTVTANGIAVPANVKLSDCPVNPDGSYRIAMELTASNGQTNTYTLDVTKVEAVEVTIKRENHVKVDIINVAGDVIAPVGGDEGVDIYKLVPGESYTWLSTVDTYYHATASFVASAGLTVNAATPKAEDWATNLAARISSSAASELTPDAPFDAADHTYTYQLESNSTTLRLLAASLNTKTYTVTVYYTSHNNTTYSAVGGTNGPKDYATAITSNTTYKSLTNVMAAGGWGNRLRVEYKQTATEDGVTFYQDYFVDVVRTMTLNSLAAADSKGASLVLTREDGTTGFDKQMFSYSISMASGASALELTFKPLSSYRYDSDYTVTVSNGSWSQTIVYSAEVQPKEPQTVTVPLTGTVDNESVTVTVSHGDETSIAQTYTLAINKLPPIATSFAVDPADAVIFLTEDATGARVASEADGSYILNTEASYTYVITARGYVTYTGSFVAGEDHAKISVSLTAAPASGLKDISVPGDWLQFRADGSNNGVVDVKTPIKAEDAVLEWSNKIGEGYDSGATGCPIIVGGYLYTYAGKSIVKVNKETGEVVASGVMASSSSFAINSPTYAEGMIFVALSGGRVQAFNADTLESLWLFADPLGGQPNCPIVYCDGNIYTGFWNSETKGANFVCLNITDEEPANTLETKLSTWSYTHNGFYWAGAYANKDFVLIGTDDGDSGYTSGTASILSLDAKTGLLIDEKKLTNVGDQRSSICYDADTDAYYFTTKGGDFYQIKVEEDGSFKENSLRRLHLDNGSDSEAAPPMSTSTPVIYNGRAYIGVSGTGQFSAYSGHNMTVIDLETFSIAYTVPTQGYPQTSGLLTTAYEDTDGYVYVYFIDNYTPGKLRVIRDRKGMTEVDHSYTTLETYSVNGVSQTIETGYVLFTPSGADAQYAICSPIADAEGNLYFKNDSARMMRLSSRITELEITTQPEKLIYEPGMTFDGTGMTVTAHYANGLSKDITDYVIYTTDPLTEDDTEITVFFDPDKLFEKEDTAEGGFWTWYQDKDGKAGQTYDLPTGTVTVDLRLEHTLGEGVQTKAPTCTEDGERSCICQICGQVFSTEPIPATGHSFENGTCGVCGEADPDDVKPIVQPVLNLSAPTLEFKDMIKVIAFFTAENIEDVVEMGMLTYTEEVEAVDINTADHVIPGAAYEESSGRYFASSQGIHAKYLGDAVYLACYAKLSDGSYVYTKLAQYSPLEYAANQLKKSTDMNLKQLVAAMLNYGAAAQTYFLHNTHTLANSTLTDEQKNLPEAYRSDMVSTVPAVDAVKQGSFANDQGFSVRKPAVSFEGAFSINYFFTPAYEPVDGITLYYWKAADFQAADVLTTENASGSIVMEVDGMGQYRADLEGIAAKNLADAVYVAAIYSDGTTTWASGVLGYSIGAYCASLATKGGTMAELAMATAVYGYHAKQYFG